MKICYLDAFSVLSGDMAVGALIDAGADSRAVLDALSSLGTGAQFRVEKTRRCGVAATKFHVERGESRAHRHLPDILNLIGKSGLSRKAKQNAEAVFRLLGEAEARVHGISIERVHFHEVGAVDSISDIAGACAALDLLGVEAVCCSAVNLGSGTVEAEHGVLPVPAPATAVLLEGKPVYSRGPAVELTTPTGAAIAAALASDFGPLPAMRIESTGYGAGDRDFPEQPNLLRVIVGEVTRAVEATTVYVIEANIDDSTPEVLGYAMEQLMEAGALDVSYSPLYMKKNRPAALLRVIATPDMRERLVEMTMRETSTLGVRIHAAERRVQARQYVEVTTPYGKVRVKVGEGSFAPEYEDCRKLALGTGVPLKSVLAAAQQAYLNELG